jgi:vancomycin resistance protein YoaR
MIGVWYLVEGYHIGRMPRFGDNPGSLYGDNHTVKDREPLGRQLHGPGVHPVRITHAPVLQGNMEKQESMTQQQSDIAERTGQRAGTVWDAINRELSQLPDPASVARRVGPRLVAGAGVLLLLFAIGVLVFRVAFDDKIYPAVVVGDVQVGGLTAEEATQRIEDRAAALNLNTVTFTYENHTWTPTLAELGATIDTESSVQRALSLGRDDNAVNRLAFTGDILQANQTVPLETRIDLNQLEAWFDRVDADIDDPAIDATIVIEGRDVSFTQDETGIVVDRETAREEIILALKTLQPIDKQLPTAVDQPQLRTADLEAGKAQVESVLSRPVEIAFEGASWTVEPEAVSQFMTVRSEMVDGTPKVAIDFDRGGLASYLRETYAGEINRLPVDATVAFSDGLYATSPSVDGVNLLANDFADAVSASFLEGHNRVDVPVHVTKPRVDSNNLAALGIEQLIGRGDSNFAGGSETRDTNIYIGVKAVNGTLVPPGEDFSFNGAVGAITAAKGYLEADVIIGEEIGRDVGGGICQVSTTAFRAALNGGFPITEWWPHSFRLLGYERDGWGPGFDASILQLGDNPANWADFRFKNTTSGWILVQSWTSYPYHIIEIFGTDMGWNVEIGNVWTEEGPKGENGNPGLDVGFVRKVTAPDGNVLSNREFYSSFKGS